MVGGLVFKEGPSTQELYFVNQQPNEKVRSQLLEHGIDVCAWCCHRLQPFSRRCTLLNKDLTDTEYTTGCNSGLFLPIARSKVFGIITPTDTIEVHF